jgi:thiol:disulfide interchange protein DsbD
MHSRIVTAKRAISALALAMIGLGAWPASGQTASELVSWRASASSVEGVAATYRVHLNATIADNWKMYALDSPRPSLGVQVTPDELPQGVEILGGFQQDEPKQAFDPNFKIDVTYFTEKAHIWFDVSAQSADVMTASVTGNVRFQICNDIRGICLPPTRAAFSVALAGAGLELDADCDDPAESGVVEEDEECDVADLDFGATSAFAPTGEEGGGASQAGAALLDGEASTTESGDGEVGAESSSGELAVARSGGFLSFLLLAIGAGLASLLTPCVFPMIPLTVSYFTKHSGNRAEALRMSSVYGLAIVVTFTGLGVIMALVVGAAGAQTIAANPWVNLFIAAVLVFFALALLGLYELRVPSGILNYFHRQGDERGGYIGILFMGFTLTLVSFSCTAPFVGGLLAATAGGEWVYPIAGMLAFSATFALPFVLLALFPNALSSLPRSGAWMNAVKVTLGFVELAAAIKFLSNADLVWGWGVVSRPLAIAVTIVIFFIAGAYLLGRLHLIHDIEPVRVGVTRILFAVLFFGLGLYMLPGLFGAPLNALDAYLPPRQATDVSLVALFSGGRQGPVDHGEAWIDDDIDRAMAEAVEAGKPLFIDFTGYTCTNCRQMESNVFVRPEVSERFSRNFVLLRLFTDGIERGEELQRYQLRLTGTVALPTYAIVDPAEGKLVVKSSGIMSTEDFVALLDRGAESYLRSTLAIR